MRAKPPTLEDWSDFLELRGPVHVQHEDGTAVSYGTSGRAEASTPGLAQVMTLDELHFVLYDELRQVQRTIPAAKVLELSDEPGPGVILDVADDVEADPGDTVNTRG